MSPAVVNEALGDDWMSRRLGCTRLRLDKLLGD
jgi:hypothetical protein